ncbi:hypothetical protein DH2020_033223 [Rehmannia glutinosa]|uniref:C3H1-type domain-containing protein n=1 Tax=Rehmannia glutinosa TaxID=99300 RepID=A0ABR0VCU7_REHGL
MESSEAAKIVHDRIKQFEPHAASKIFGSIYWQHQNPDHEMIRLAFGPDNLIRNVIQKAKTALILHSSPIISTSISHPYFPNEDHNFDQSCSFQNHYGDMSIRGRRNSPNVTDYNSVKSCHYFSRGFCKHGSNCRYFHGESSFPSPRVFGYDDDRVLYFENLEMEVVELLKSRKGQPISIASLPMMYFEKYGKTLQAEGYLTESQRHGKAGYNLTKLLAQLKNIRLIDRPHGQHAVMLAEDAIWGDRYEHSQIINGSRQIYMTFLANSTFTEEEYVRSGSGREDSVPEEPDVRFCDICERRR